MTYVPIIVPPTPPSPRTRELAREIERTIVDFEQLHPSVTRAELQQATRLAMQATGGQGHELAAVSGVLGLLAAAALGAYVYVSDAGGGSPTGGEVPYSLIAVATGVVVVAIAFAFRRRP